MPLFSQTWRRPAVQGGAGEKESTQAQLGLEGVAAATSGFERSSASLGPLETAEEAGMCSSDSRLAP